MGGPVFYSTNPWFATEVANKYRGGVHFAWVCECFDSSKAAAGTAAALIAPSSNPKRIYDTLYEDCKKEDRHSALIKGYKRKFRLLGRAWAGDESISDEQCEDIIATVNSRSWKIWRACPLCDSSCRNRRWQDSICQSARSRRIWPRTTNR